MSQNYPLQQHSDGVNIMGHFPRIPCVLANIYQGEIAIKYIYPNDLGMVVQNWSQINTEMVWEAIRSTNKWLKHLR